MSYLKVTPEGLKVDWEYILLYPEFEKLYKRDDDPEKKYADKLLRYIYERCDVKSYCVKNGLKEREAHKHALQLAGLPFSFDLDKDIVQAMKRYKQIHYNEVADLLSSLRNTLKLSKKINDKIQKAIEVRLSNPDMKEEDIPHMIMLEEKLFKVIENLPDKIKSLKELESVVHKELTKPKGLGRGQKVIPDSYDGDPEIEGA